jgi:HNH endonuclease
VRWIEHSSTTRTSPPNRDNRLITIEENELTVNGNLLGKLLPIGTKRLYQAMRDAGIHRAMPQRNVQWINVADDGVTVLNWWRIDMEEREDTIVGVVDARDWPSDIGTKAKRNAVIDGLAKLNGNVIRVIVLEGVRGARRQSGARYDQGADWLVEDTGDDFLIWRGWTADIARSPIPDTPQGFGNVDPPRREAVSTQIERDPRVKAFTLKRALYRCEISGCRDAVDFQSMDVHHITRLGDGGSDHTDNTVALCPACHSRIHRGTNDIQQKLGERVAAIRNRRLKRK